MRLFKILFFLVFIFGCDDNKADSTVSTSQKTPSHKKNDNVAMAKRAHTYYELSNCDKAVRVYDSLIKLDSTKGGYFFKRGYCKSLLFDKNGAIEDYKKSIALNYSEKKIAYYNIGIMYQVVFKKYDSALYYYDQYLKINPYDSSIIKARNETAKSLKKM